MILPIAVAVLILIAMLAFGGLTTDVGQWYRDLKKPAWNPPDRAFGPAWTLILSLAAWSGVEAWNNVRGPEDQWRIGLLFGANVIAHLLWSPLFFNLKRPDWALIGVVFLWLSLVALMVGLWPISALASLLIVPYLLWVSFAAFLNWTIVRLNPPFGAQR
jgi:benzodiazapine receptor